jgi:DNA-binding SARP family transcriptional activator/TolB-like protein
MEGSRIARRTAGRLRLRVFGGFSLERPDAHTIAIANRKACALLAYLALRPERIDTRERLAGLLWSDRSEEQARASLRQCLKQLRGMFDQIGFHGFHTERLNVSLDGDIDIDLHDVEARLAGREVAQGLISGEASPDGILYGYETLDEAYGAWLHIMRRTWQDRLAAELQALMKAGRDDLAHRAAEALVAIDPTHEEAHRHLIRRHADTGNISAALKLYNLLWDLLGEEYDMEPADETQALIAEIKSGQYVPAQQNVQPRGAVAANPVSAGFLIPDDRISRAQPRLPTIGISRFARGGPWIHDDYLIEGFRRELVASMIRFREWVIVEGDSSSSDWQPAPAAGRTAVDYQVEGVYHNHDGVVHQTITLKDFASNRYIWSERITLSVDNWFTAQQEIVRRISVALNVYLSTERLSRLSQRSFVPEIYDKWLQGQQQLSHWNPDAERRAERTFKEIIASAPDFAPAFSSLAAIYNSRHFKNPGLFRTEEDAANALHCAQRSVRLDPLDTRNQLSLAWSNAMHNRFDQAEVHFNLTYELNSNSPITLIPSAHGLSFCGNHDLANALAETAIRLNPSMPGFHWGYVLCIRFFNQDFDGSLAAAEIAQDTITDLHAWKAAALAHAGYRTEAVETAARFVTLVRERWAGSARPTDERIVKWFLHSFPIRRKEDYQLLEEGLALAGLLERAS